MYGVLAELSLYTAHVFAIRLANTLQPVESYSTPVIPIDRLRF